MISAHQHFCFVHPNPCWAWTLTVLLDLLTGKLAHWFSDCSTGSGVYVFLEGKLCQFTDS